MDATKQAAGTVEPLKVNIFNQPYHLRTDGDGEYVRQLARFVDERMQAISSHTSIVDYAKVAVLAALNIADELHRLKLKNEMAEAEEAARVSAEAKDERAEQEQTSAAAVESESRAGDSWSYSDIFEALPARSESLPKLGQNITNRLRQLRGENGLAPSTEPEE